MDCADPKFGIDVNSFAATVKELVERGHEVLWLCGPRFCDQIAATGATFVPWGVSVCDADIVPAAPSPGTSGKAFLEVFALNTSQCKVSSLVLGQELCS